MRSSAHRGLIAKNRARGYGPVVINQEPDARHWQQWRADGLPKVPPMHRRELAQLDRYYAVEAARDLIDPSHARQTRLARQQIIDDLDDCAERRRVELELSDYIDRVGRALVRPQLVDVAHRMRDCRQTATVGVCPHTDRVVKVWDHKCGYVRVCPDEAREETQRIAQKYVPAMLEWAEAKPGRRLQYAVLTAHNFNNLAAGKRLLFDWFRQRILGDVAACPVAFRGRRSIPSRRRKLVAFPAIKGALVIQEDPLSAHGDWNVHLNVIFAIEGELNWAELRRAWGYNLHIRELPAEDAALRHAVLELVKYSALHVGAKSSQKADAGLSGAPPMVQWPPQLWAEWFDAQQRFRRTRSYGDWYGESLADLIEQAKEKAKEAKKPEFCLEDVRWIGECSFDGRTRNYRVTLIHGDNFSTSIRPEWAPSEKVISPPPTGPP